MGCKPLGLVHYVQAHQMSRMPWDEWQEITKRIYVPLGWPRAEMRKYWESGMSPLKAKEAAESRRVMLKKGNAYAD